MAHTADTSSPDGILRLGNLFCDAKALLTAVELSLFTVLRDAPASEDQLRERLELHGRGLSDWLALLVELDLLAVDGGRYRNSTGADRYLVRGEETYIGGFIERSNRNLYPAWGRLAEALRTGEQQTGSSFDAMIENPATLGQFVASMDALTQVIGPQLVQAYDGWGGHESVVDIGGCRGALTALVLKAHPHLSGVVFDLPQMTPFFAALAAEQALGSRLSFHPGSFFTDPLPAADLVMIGHVLHDWDEGKRRALVSKAFEAVNPGGTLLVYDRMLDRESGRIENLVISLDMLLVTEGGSEYTVSELRDHSLAAGFESVRDVPLGEYDTLVIASKAR